MREAWLVPLFLFVAQALTFWAAPSACAEDITEPAAQDTRSTSAVSATADKPVLSIIRAKLAEPELRKEAHADDLAALKAFYDERESRPLWTTDMGFSAKGQQALFEIVNAEKWGLAGAVFDLPPAGALPAGPEQQVVAEIKLNLAVLKYARLARGGRADALGEERQRAGDA